jgi:hypothetical protein
MRVGKQLSMAEGIEPGRATAENKIKLTLSHGVEEERSCC